MIAMRRKAATQVTNGRTSSLKKLGGGSATLVAAMMVVNACLLYTSDAADE